MAKKPTQSQRHSNSPTASKPVQLQQTVTHYQGAVPHPDILAGIDKIVPGAAARLVTLAEEESHHRRNLELKAIEANIATQEQQTQIAQQQSRDVFKSDMIGQIFGFIVCLSCICAAIYLGINGHDVLAAGIAAVPTAALIKAFVLNKNK